MKLSDFPQVALPKRVRNCPIIEAVLEVRFETSFDNDAVYGSVYSIVKSDWAKGDKLPITEIPHFMRESDPALKFSPHYRLTKDNLLLQIGPAVISIVSRSPYVGSEILFQEFDTVFDKLSKTDLFQRFIRVGVRYIDFFDNNIFDGLKCNFALCDIPTHPQRTHIRTTIEGKDGFNLTLQLAGRVVTENPDQAGFVFDVDTACDLKESPSIEEVKQLLRSAHIQQKQLFFGLLKPEMLTKMEPEYE
jgi:uncharacterized protein (TIGR04255 family)